MPEARDKDHQRALDRFSLGTNALKSQREREKKALEFQVPEKQWPSDVIKHREAVVVGGMTLPKRASLSIPTLDQPIQLVLNQERQAHLGVKVSPVSEDADDDTAEAIQGIYRCIERDSRAHLARSWAHERAVKAGLGGYRVLTAFDTDSPEKNDLKIVIKRILHQETLVFDPFAEEPDWSDGEWAFVAAWVPFSRYKRQHKKLRQQKGDTVSIMSRLASMDDRLLDELATECPGWVTGDGEGRAVLVAEYFEVITDDEGHRTVRWRKMNGVEWMDEEEWPGQYIPIIPTVGRELIPFDAERRWVGIYEPNMDAARLFNYAASAAVETNALEPRAPLDVDPEEIQGFEAFYREANIRNWPYLPRRKVLNGQLLPPLQRVQADTSKLQMSLMLLEQARNFIHAGTGAFEPTLGEQSPNVRTKGATLALQQQHDAGTSHWLDNLAQISMALEAKIILDLMPKIYNRRGRVLRIIDGEDKTSSVMLGQPFVVDPKTKRPLPASPDAKDVKNFDLTKGKYSVAVSVGKGYKTRLEEGHDKLGQLFQAEPQLFQLLGDIYLRFCDFPGHDEAAKRVQKMLPPQAQDNESGQPTVEQLQAELQKMQQVFQAMTQELEAKTKYIETEQVKLDAQAQLKMAEFAHKEELERMTNQTKIAIEEMKIAAAAASQIADAEREVVGIGLTQRHEAIEGERERAAEQGAQQQQLEHEAAEGDKQRQHEKETQAVDLTVQAAESDTDRKHERQMQKEKPQPKAGK